MDKVTIIHFFAVRELRAAYHTSTVKADSTTTPYFNLQPGPFRARLVAFAAQPAPRQRARPVAAMLDACKESMFGCLFALVLAN
jgi:hypothetical protein